MAGSSGGINGSSPGLGGVTPGSKPIKPEELKTPTAGTDSSGRKVNFTEPDDVDLGFNQLVSERLDVKIEDRVLNKTEKNTDDDEEFFDAPESLEPRSGWATFDDDSSGGFEFPKESEEDPANLTPGLQKLFGEDEVQPNPWVTQSVNNAAKTLQALNRDPYTTTEAFVSPWQQVKNQLDSTHDLKLQVVRMAESQDDQDHLKVQDFLMAQAEETDPDAIKRLEANIKSLELAISRRELNVRQTVTELDAQIEQLEAKLAQTKDPLRRTKQVKQQQSPEGQKKALEQGREAYKARLAVHAEKQKSVVTAKQQSLDQQTQQRIDEQTKIIALLNDLSTASEQQIHDAITWLQSDIEATSVEIRHLEGRHKQANKEVMTAIEQLINEKSAKIDQLSSLIDLLDSLEVEIQITDPVKVEEHKGWLQADNDLLTRTIESRKKTAEKLYARIDAKLESDADAFFVVDDPEFWATPKGAVYSAETLPFAIKPGDAAFDSEIYHDGLLFAAEEEGDFPDASPLLGQKEQLRDAEGNPAYGLKLEKHYELDEYGKPVVHEKPVPKFDKEGNLETKVLYNKAWIKSDDGKVVYDDTVTIQPVYEEDLTRPLYGYDANHNPATINKKKLKEYKGAIRIAHAVKLFFKGTGTRLRNAFNFFKLRTSGAKAQRAIERMARDPENVFGGELNNTAFFKLFRDVYSGKYKKNVVGLQRFHDLMAETLSSKLEFTDKEHKGGYENAMTTLVMVGAGLIDARDEEGNVFGYHRLDTPAEQVVGLRLDSSITAEQRDQVLRLAKHREGRKLAGHIKSKHLTRAGELVALAAKEKKAVEEANAKAIKAGRMQDVRDADEAAKQKLIETVIAKAGKRLPDDLHQKLEVMRDNLTDNLPLSDAMVEGDTTAMDYNRSQLVLPEAEIKALQKKIAEIDAGNPKVHSSKGAFLRQLRHAQEKQALERELQAHIAAREKQKAVLRTTESHIKKRLGQTKVLTEQSRSIISKGILMHCGMTVPADPTQSMDVGKYEMSKVKIQKHQREAAIKLADDIAYYLESGGNPTGTGVYEILTQHPPVSARDGGPAEFTKDIPPHPLHATTLKAQLQTAFEAEELATHKNRAMGERVDLEALSHSLAGILSKSGHLLGGDRKTVNTELAKILSMHVLVATKSATLTDQKAGVASGLQPKNNGEDALTAKQVKTARQMAHQVLNEMNKAEITPHALAKKVYPRNKALRDVLLKDLNSAWVR